MCLGPRHICLGPRHMCLGPRHMCLDPRHMCPGQNKMIVTEKSENFSVFDVKKWKFGDHLKRVLAKFQVNRSHPRGVNGPSKFGKISKKNCFRHRKMKRRESPETRFGKVSSQSEPSSGGKRPFEVWKSHYRAWGRSVISVFIYKNHTT